MNITQIIPDPPGKVELKSDPKLKPKSKGLGDSIKRVTDALKIPQCGGCKRRQEKLNRLFPYNKKGKNKE
tara:strand:+ start:2606 stop:2815 length:210 start_codon:yes stop_codon:yes gene_type:complete